MTELPTDLMTASELSELLGLSEAALSNWRKKNIGPVYFQFENGAVRYRRADVLSWLERQMVMTG